MIATIIKMFISGLIATIGLLFVMLGAKILYMSLLSIWHLLGGEVMEGGLVIDDGKLIIDNDKFCDRHSVEWFEVHYRGEDGNIIVEKYTKGKGWEVVKIFSGNLVPREES